MKTRPVIIPIGPSIAYVQLTRGKFCLIDREDAEWAGQWNWCAEYRPETTEEFRAVRVEQIYMHRALLGLERGDPLTVDHLAPGRPMDNRRANLRKATRRQNQQNRRMTRTNKSGYKGVSLHKPSGQWSAAIKVFDQFIWLGRHDTKEAAYAAYCEAAKKYFGEFAHTP